MQTQLKIDLQISTKVPPQAESLVRLVEPIPPERPNSNVTEDSNLDCLKLWKCPITKVLHFYMLHSEALIQSKTSPVMIGGKHCHSLFTALVRTHHDADYNGQYYDILLYQPDGCRRLCCITQVMMREPVIAADGHTYERVALQQWLRNIYVSYVYVTYSIQQQDTSPMTGSVQLHKHFFPNIVIRNMLAQQQQHRLH